MHDYAIVMQQVNSNVQLIGPAALAALLNKSEATIRSDVHRAPDRLPPRTKLPGSNRLFWRKSTVESWILQGEQGAQE